MQSQAALETSPCPSPPPFMEPQPLREKGAGRSPVRFWGLSLRCGSPRKGLGPKRASTSPAAPDSGVRGSSWRRHKETSNRTAEDRVRPSDPQAWVPAGQSAEDPALSGFPAETSEVRKAGLAALRQTPTGAECEPSPGDHSGAEGRHQRLPLVCTNAPSLTVRLPSRKQVYPRHVEDA